jgi:hypothetical protein
MVTAIDIASARAGVQSFEAWRPPERIRLTAVEVGLIRFVFCDWETVMGVRAIDYESFGPGGTNPDDQMLDCEAWHSTPRKRRLAVHRTWRALKMLGERVPLSQAVLFRLYGAPVRVAPYELFGQDVAKEYAPIAHFTPLVGTRERLDSLLHLETARREGESKEAHGARVSSQRAARVSLLLEIGRQAERLIVAAAVDYRQSWRDVS